MAFRSFQMARCVCALALISIAACSSTHSGRDDDDDDQDGGATGDGDGDTNADGRQAPAGPACFASELRGEVSTVAIQNVDVVFAVDNSESMADEQASLAAQLPRLVRSLSRGDFGDDGTADFPPATSVHLAVVSTDLGVPGVTGVAGCEGVGDDGMFNSAGCGSTTLSPPFLTFEPGDDADQIAAEVGCLSALGVAGCTIEQPLESMLKAVWPRSDSNVTFLTAVPGQTQTGGNSGPGAPNGEFFRNGEADSPSVIALVVVTDEDDCSTRDPSFLAAGASPNGIGTRCFFESLNGDQAKLFAIDRYIQLFKMLHPGSENLVIFEGIVGVPARLTTPEVLADIDFDAPGEADAYFDMLLAAPEMQELVDDKQTPDTLTDDGIVPSCDRGADARAYPPRRIVQVAKGFGANGIVQSICQDDFGPAIDALIARIALNLGAPCLPRALARGSDGSLACELTWELGVGAGPGPRSCDELPFVSATGELGDRGGPICKLEQLVVTSDDGVEGDGWYYDDFSATTEVSCTGTQKQRIVFAGRAAAAPPGVVARMSCFQAEHAESSEADAVCSAGPASTDTDVVGDPCLTLVEPADGFDDSVAYVEGNHPDCGEGGACLVYHLGGNPGPDCVPDFANGLLCPTPDDVQARVYCTCRCDAPEDFAECACPDGFSCVDVIENGPAEIAGGYCVRNGTSFASD